MSSKLCEFIRKQLLPKLWKEFNWALSPWLDSCSQMEERVLLSFMQLLKYRCDPIRFSLKNCEWLYAFYISELLPKLSDDSNETKVRNCLVMLTVHSNWNKACSSDIISNFLIRLIIVIQKLNYEFSSISVGSWEPPGIFSKGVLDEPGKTYLHKILSWCLLYFVWSPFYEVISQKNLIFYVSKSDNEDYENDGHFTFLSECRSQLCNGWVACEREREEQMFQLNLQPIAADCNRLD